MAYFVVYSESKHFFAIKKEWLERPVLGVISKMFFAGDWNAISDFNVDTEYYINRHREACYKVFVYKSFETEIEAKHFATKKRPSAPVDYKSGIKFISKRKYFGPVAYLELSDSENEDQSDSDDGMQSVGSDTTPNNSFVEPNDQNTDEVSVQKENEVSL